MDQTARLAAGDSMALPIFQTQNKDLTLMQNSWSSQLNPLLINPSLQSIILKKVSLSIGANIINHLLGRTLQGYRIVRQRLPASIFDAQDQNSMPNLTLVLISDAAVVCDIEVF